MMSDRNRDRKPEAKALCSNRAEEESFTRETGEFAEEKTLIKDENRDLAGNDWGGECTWIPGASNPFISN